MNVVFIHLGPANNKHLISNIHRFREIFPQHAIHLVVSTDSRISDTPEYVKRHTYFPDNRTEKLLQSLARDNNFRQGFWRYSLERLLAIKTVHGIFPQQPLIHFESDILIMPNFPFDEITRADTLMWNMYNADHDVSAILFSPNIEETLKLEELILTKIQQDPSLTDMTVLNKIWRDASIEVEHFASICKELPEIMNGLSEPFQGDVGGKGFGGIFDGAAIGMWLLGHDPKNNYGKSIIHSDSVITNGNSAIDPSSINYDLTDEGELYAVSKENPSIRIPIWDLHAHCKNGTLLSTQWQAELRRYVELAKFPEQINVMDWSIVWSMFITSLKTRTFIGFVVGIPQLQPLRRKLSPLKRFIKKPI